MKSQLKRVSVCLFLFFLTAASCGLYAEDSNRHFGIEIFGGFSLIDPSDLNKRVEMDRQYETLFRDNYYTHLVNIGAYSQAAKLAGGDFKSLRQAIPVGLRFRYYFSDSLSVSIGFSYIRGAQSSNFTNHFLLSRDGQTYQEKYIYSPYRIAASAYIPSVGFHFKMNAFKSLELEAGVVGGPMWNSCCISFDFHREWMTEDGELLHEYKFTSLKETGSGTGFSLEANIRLFLRLDDVVRPFIQLGYVYRQAGSFNGRGYKRDEGDIFWWEDEWGMKVYQEYRPYGFIDILFPSNNWTDYRTRAGDFVLDLSGIQAAAGILFRF